MDNCLACKLNSDPSGAPGGRIKDYNYWALEHIVEPIPVKGWLILKTKRHTEGITGINQDEASELGEILNQLPKLQKKLCKADQVYLCCFTELVSHLHIHLIPRSANETRKGPELFGLLNEVRSDNKEAVNINEAIEFVEILKKELEK